MAQNKKNRKSRQALRAKSIFEEELAPPSSKDAVAKTTGTPGAPKVKAKAAPKTVVETQLETPVNKDALARIKAIRKAPKAAVKAPAKAVTKTVVEAQLATPVNKDALARLKEIRKAPRPAAKPAALQPSAEESPILLKEPRPILAKKDRQQDSERILKSKRPGVKAAEEPAAPKPVRNNGKRHGSINGLFFWAGRQMSNINAFLNEPKVKK